MGELQAWLKNLSNWLNIEDIFMFFLSKLNVVIRYFPAHMLHWSINCIRLNIRLKTSITPADMTTVLASALNTAVSIIPMLLSLMCVMCVME